MKLEQLKIFPDDHAWFTDEQNRIKRQSGEKPTQAELFQKMKEAYEMAGSVPKPKPNVQPVVKRLYPPEETKNKRRA